MLVSIVGTKRLGWFSGFKQANCLFHTSANVLPFVLQCTGITCCCVFIKSSSCCIKKKDYEDQVLMPNVYDDEVVKYIVDQFYRLGLDGEACVNRLLCEVTAHPMVAKVVKNQN